jgi:hypothetical protein
MPLVSGSAAGLEADFIQDLLHCDLAAEGVEVNACHVLVQGFLLRLQAFRTHRAGKSNAAFRS